MNRTLFFTIIKLYVLFFILRAIANYISYPLGIPVGFGWAFAVGLFIFWLIRRFQRHERTRQPAIEINMGESEPITAEERDRESRFSRGEVPLLSNGVVSIGGEQIETDSMKWIVWIKDQDTVDLKIENNDPEYSYFLRKRPGTQAWVAFKGEQEIDAGLSESLFQRKLDEIGAFFSSEQNTVMPG